MSYKVISVNNSFSLPLWSRLEAMDHEKARHDWVINKLKVYASSSKTLIDVGCGSQPFRETAETLGVRYFSHDFQDYKESLKTQFGLHNDETPIGKVDFVCDFYSIPEKDQFDIVLCTEVLEHLPDPALAFVKLLNLLKPDGVLILTVPGLSWTHQAPYFFSSGLSPYWVNHHANLNNSIVVEGAAIGFMRDLFKYLMPVYESGIRSLHLKLLGKLYRCLVSRVVNFEASVHDAAVLQIAAVVRKVDHT
jgi:SAM-dependent methyltransferase